MTRAPRVPLGAEGRPAGRDPELVSALAAYQDAVVRSPHLDATTTELIRLRCARQHDCRICQTLRLADAVAVGVDDAMTDQIDHYEDSTLSERHKVALRLVDAVIWRPADMDDRLVADVHAHFSDVEIAEILVDITKWSTQKIHVTLGTDGADHLPKDGAGHTYLSFADDGRVASMTASRPERG